jgi:integrase
LIVASRHFIVGQFESLNSGGLEDMVRKGDRLNALAVQRARKRGLLHDGSGLYLQITKGGVKSWLFRYMIKGRARAMGLGPLANVTLAHARGLAAACRQQLQQGIDPIDARRAQQKQAKVVAAKGVSFRACAEQYIKSHRSAWRSERHAHQWQRTLETYAFPTLGDMPVGQIDVAAVMRVLEPIWQTKTETANRVRGRIESVLDWARARGYRDAENPARWRGHLQNLLPRQAKIQAVRHHPAMAYSEVGAFMTLLRAHEGRPALALQFVVLTAARTGEVLGAKWDEIDIDAALWVIPARRTKQNREHRIPLAPAALAILIKLRGTAEGAYIFTDGKKDAPLHNMTLLRLLRHFSHHGITTHGFRSTFSDWVAECTAYPAEVREAALGHAVGDKVVAAYKRGDALEKRRRLMAKWAEFCAQSGRRGEVAPLRREGPLTK